ncbi:hypothetical protein FQN57_002317 [Myotisia sp. PD_48]|nr:hypothetical protein FQN57_002317 [Myotisia sp. PD_48]
MFVSKKLLMAVLAYDAAVAVVGMSNAFDAEVGYVDPIANAQHGVEVRDAGETVTLTVTHCGPAPEPSTSTWVSVPNTSVPHSSRVETSVAHSSEVHTTRVPSVSTSAVETSLTRSVKSTDVTTKIRITTTSTEEVSQTTSHSATPTPTGMAAHNAGFAPAVLAGIAGAAAMFVM